MTQEKPRSVWFYREYVRLTGGHLKHAHYFGHVASLANFSARITLAGEPQDAVAAREVDELWPIENGVREPRWRPHRRDVLFLAGLDWQYLHHHGLERLRNPRINLIQHVRHAHEGTRLYNYLSERAVRICVSPEVADAISNTDRTNGPVLVIPNGTDLQPVNDVELQALTNTDARERRLTIVGYKDPQLARALSERLNENHVEHSLVTEFCERHAFVNIVKRSAVVVCCPDPEEGFYLPALEAMALGCIVVTNDCVGNRSFCRHEDSCLIAERSVDALFCAAKRALAMNSIEREKLLRGARASARRHSLESERSRFHAILQDIDQLW